MDEIRDLIDASRRRHDGPGRSTHILRRAGGTLAARYPSRLNRGLARPCQQVRRNAAAARVCRGEIAMVGRYACRAGSSPTDGGQTLPTLTPTDDGRLLQLGPAKVRYVMLAAVGHRLRGLPPARLGAVFKGVRR